MPTVVGRGGVEPPEIVAVGSAPIGDTVVTAAALPDTVENRDRDHNRSRSRSGETTDASGPYTR